MHILTLFFAIDGSHAKKRILAFKNNTEKVSIVSYYRDNNIEYENHYNLGKSTQKHYLRRFLKILLDVPRLMSILNSNPDIQVVYAWNFDIALLFRITNLFSKRKYIFVYEVADIKPILLSQSIVGKTLRKLEQYILNKTDFLCVTSETFIENYFNRYFNYNGRVQLLENKLYPPIEIANINSNPISKDKWIIGYFGLYRCKISMNLLYDIASELPEMVEIVLAGKPENIVNNDFLKLVKLHNVTDLGEYQYPDDLQNIYSKIDIIWSADFSDLSVNSKWLLPNRIYEAGSFSVPQLCFSNNVAICKYIDKLEIGWILEDNSIETLKSFIMNLNLKDFNKIKHGYHKLSANQFSGNDQIQELLKNIKDDLNENNTKSN